MIYRLLILCLFFVCFQDNNMEYYLYVSIVDGGVYDYSPLEVSWQLLVIDVDRFSYKIKSFSNYRVQLVN